jgi:hypothetical protein
MTSSFPRLLAAWLGVRVANRKKVRWQSIATHESGGLSPFRGHSSALNASVQFTRAGAFGKCDVRESGLSRLPRRRRERAHARVSACRGMPQEGGDCRRQSPDAGDKNVLTASCRPELSRFGPTTPTRPPGLPLALCRLDRPSCCRSLLDHERLSPSARERVLADLGLLPLVGRSWVGPSGRRKVEDTRRSRPQAIRALAVS